MQIATVVTIMMITMMMRMMMKVMINISGRDWNAVAEALICVRRTWPKLTPDQTMIKMRVMMARMIMVMVNMMMVMVNMIMMMINVLISMLALKPQESKPDFLQYISFISKRDCWRKSCHIGRMSHKRGFPVLPPTLCRPCHPPHMVASSVISTLAAGEGLSLVLHVKISKAGKSGIRVIHTCMIRQI